MRKITATVEEVLRANTAKQRGTSCILWTGSKLNAGYGQVTVNGRSQLAHRVAFVHAYPKVDISEFQINHKCDNPSCVNPCHLYAGTQSENVRDAVRRGRHKHAACRGEDSPHHKLVDTDIPIIRARRASGETLRAIGADYGLNSGTIWAVVTRNTWKHVK